MADLSDQEIRIIIKHIPMMVSWIREDKRFSDDRVVKMNRRMEELTKILLKLTYEDLIDILEKNADHPIYGEILKIALTAKGKKWMERMLAQVQKVGFR
jgi:transcriptional regulator of NAD metabolism